MYIYIYVYIYILVFKFNVHDTIFNDLDYFAFLWIE